MMKNFHLCTYYYSHRRSTYGFLRSMTCRLDIMLINVLRKKPLNHDSNITTMYVCEKDGVKKDDLDEFKRKLTRVGLNNNFLHVCLT